MDIIITLIVALAFRAFFRWLFVSLFCLFVIVIVIVIIIFFFFFFLIFICNVSCISSAQVPLLQE